MVMITAPLYTSVYISLQKKVFFCQYTGRGIPRPLDSTSLPFLLDGSIILVDELKRMKYCLQLLLPKNRITFLHLLNKDAWYILRHKELKSNIIRAILGSRIYLQELFKYEIYFSYIFGPGLDELLMETE